MNKYGVDLRLTIKNDWTPDDFEDFYINEFVGKFIEGCGYCCGGGASDVDGGHLIRVVVETGGSILEADCAMDLLETWCDNRGLKFDLDFDIVKLNQ